MRTLTINHGMEHSQLLRYFMGVHQIMHRYQVSRATAYRYLRSVPGECKIRIRIGEGKPCTMGQIVALDRAHANAKPGNPRLSPEHQKKAIQQRWTAYRNQHETNISETH